MGCKILLQPISKGGGDYIGLCHKDVTTPYVLSSSARFLLLDLPELLPLFYDEDPSIERLPGIEGLKSFVIPKVNSE